MLHQIIYYMPCLNSVGGNAPIELPPPPKHPLYSVSDQMLNAFSIPLSQEEHAELDLSCDKSSLIL